MAKDPYAGSNYDAAGMPLGTTFVDCDNADEVRKAMVKDKVVEPQNHVFDLDYQAKQIKSERQLKQEDFNGALADQVGIPGIDSDIVRADTSIVDYTEKPEHGNVEKIAIGEAYDDILEVVLKAPEKASEEPVESKEDNDGKV